MSFRSERMTGLARLRSRLPTRPRPFKQFTGLFEFACGEPAFSSPPHCKTKRTPKRCPFILERMTGLARLRSRLPTRPRPFKQFTGLFEFACGEPAFSSPPHCKTKRTPKRCPFILERMTGLEPATSTLARWRSTR